MTKKEYTRENKTFYVSAFMLYNTYGINCDYNTKFRVHYTLGGKSYVIINNMRLYI